MFVWVCLDNNKVAAQFLSQIERTGSCPELADMCDIVVFFVNGFHNFNTIGEICPLTCNLCPGTFDKNNNFHKLSPKYLNFSIFQGFTRSALIKFKILWQTKIWKLFFTQSNNAFLSVKPYGENFAFFQTLFKIHLCRLELQLPSPLE